MNNTEPYEKYINRVCHYIMRRSVLPDVRVYYTARQAGRIGDLVTESEETLRPDHKSDCGPCDSGHTERRKTAEGDITSSLHHTGNQPEGDSTSGVLYDEERPETNNTRSIFYTEEHLEADNTSGTYYAEERSEADSTSSSLHTDERPGNDNTSSTFYNEEHLEGDSASGDHFTKEQPEDDSTSSTPYDDAFKTMMGKGGELRIAFVNEMFHPEPPVKPDTRIDETSNEYFTEQGNGSQRKIITDNVLHINGRTYHIECQSFADGTMLVRMVEYDVAIGVKESIYEDSHLTLNIPVSGVLFLRSTRTTPDEMTVTVNTVGGSVDYPVRVMKLSDYTLDDLIEKDLLFLFPFYVFNLESDIRNFEREESKKKVIGSFTELLEYVNDMYEKGKLNFDKYLLLTDMVKKVADSLSRNHSNARKELDDIMGGKILEFRGERIYNKGKQEGREEGIGIGLKEGKAAGLKEGREEGIEIGIKQGEKKGKVSGLKEGRIYDLLDLAYDHTLPVDVAAKRAETRYGVPKEEFMKMLETYNPDDELMQG